MLNSSFPRRPRGLCPSPYFRLATVVPAVVVAALLVLAAGPASASFHIVHVESVMNGFGPDPDIEYVELEMGAAGQNKFNNTRLTFFNADGTTATVLDVADANVPSAVSGDSVLFATAAFGTASGVIPDFFFAPGTIENSGMICWGAPGLSTPPNPSTWDAGNPDNYVDCVAFGDYSGTLPSGKSKASSDPPGSGQTALNRIGDTGDDDVDFQLGLPRPCNNAGDCAVLTTPTTITSTTVLPTISSTTSSTIQVNRECCGDVDGNGEVRASDALAVLRRAVGLDVEFSCAEVCFAN
jgi:hypothetical protein